MALAMKNKQELEWNFNECPLSASSFPGQACYYSLFNQPWKSSSVQRRDRAYCSRYS